MNRDQGTSNQDGLPLPWRRLTDLARRDPRRATRLARRAAAQARTDPAEQAWASFALGWALIFWERFDEARLHLRAAQRAFSGAGLAQAVQRCGFALLLADLYQAGSGPAELLTQAVADLNRAGLRNEALHIQFFHALMLAGLGHLDQAEQLLAQIEPDLGRADPVDQGRMPLIRGMIALQRGQPDLASQHITQADAHFARLRCSLERARCWLQLGWLEGNCSRLAASLRYYRRAERSYQSMDLPVRLALCRRSLGWVLSLQGDYADAMRVLFSATAALMEQGRTVDVGICLINLGNIYFYGAQWEAALACYTRAEGAFDQVGLAYYQIVARRNAAMVHRTQGRASAANRLLDQAQELAEHNSNRAELAEVLGERAALLADGGDIAAAERCYWRAHDTFLETGSALDAAECLVELGWLKLRGDPAGARRLFQQAELDVEDQPYYRWRAAYGLARCAEAAGEIDQALQHYGAALATVADMRGNLAHGQFSSSLYDQAASLYHDALGLAVREQRAELVLTFGEHQRALALQHAIEAQSFTPDAQSRQNLERQRRQLAALLADPAASGASLSDQLLAYTDLLLGAISRVSRPAATRGAQPFDLARLRAQLGGAYGGDWTALIYLLHDQTLLISILTPDGLWLEPLPFDEELREQIGTAGDADFARYVYRDVPFLNGETDEPWEQLRVMTRRLLPERALARLHPQHRLLIAPADALHGLPWGLLRLEQSWLLEQAIVQIVPSLAVWQSLDDTPPSQAQRALLVGCDTFVSANALPAVTHELEQVARHWSDPSDVLFNEGATRAALLDRAAHGELARYRLLHFATHAQLLTTQTSGAHLALSDGDLRLEEIAGLGLGGALVMLSACEGASADILPGEELVSLSWALLAAGATAVIASLWLIDDEPTSLFMARFYERLAERRDPCATLAHTQRELLRDQALVDGPDGPVHWGGFVFIGAERPLR
jgi:tetratricopeptide (TPR) repeat protein